MDSNPIEQILERAQALNDQQSFAESLGTVGQAIEEVGLSPEMDLVRAESLIGLERFRDAYDTLQNLLDQGGERVRPRSLMLKARVLRRSSRYLDSALEAAVDAGTAAERVGETARVVMGQAHLEAARMFAIKRCRGLSDREIAIASVALPDDPMVGFYRAAIDMEFDNRPAAKRHYEALLDTTDIGRFFGTTGLAYLEYVMGAFDTAHEHLDALEPLPSGAIWPRRIRASILEAQQRWDETAEALEALREASPQADSVWRDAYDRANCLYRARRIDDALGACEEIMGSVPNDNHYGALAARMGRLLSHPEIEHRRRRRLKAFPSVTQLRDHCGPASCELYLRYFGLTDSQVEIARNIKRPDGGTPVYKMRRYLEDAGFDARRVEAGLPTIKRLIDAGLPVIMEESYSSSTHVAVAIGYDDARELLEVQDPMTHSVRETFYEDLPAIRNLSNHGALVAAPKSDVELVAALNEAGADECRYISLVDQAWASLDDDKPAEGDKLVDESVQLHREYELAWIYRFRRARDVAQDDPSTEHRIKLHQILGEITSMWPDDEWPQQLLGEALFFDNRSSEALVAFERARDRDPGDPYNWSMIADCQLRLGNNDAAHDALIEALARDPSHGRSNENLADLAYRRRNMTMARMLNEAARELRPSNFFNHAIHGQLLSHDDRAKKALEAYDRAIDLEPDRGWVITLRGKLLGKMGRVDEAVEALQGLVDKRPDDAGAKIDLADLLYANDRAERSIEVCNAMIEADAKAAPAHAIMGASLAKLGKLDEGIEAFKKALALRPTYTWVFTEMGNFLMEAERTLEAIQAYAAALGMSGGNARREFDLGDALVRAGYTDDGVRHLRAAGIYGRLDEDELGRIGELMIESRGGRYADSFFDEVKSKRPDDLEVLRAHAHTLLEVLWAPSAAREVLAKIRAMAPDDPYALVARGEELMDSSLDTEAEGETLLQSALEAAPELDYARRIAGDAYNERGRFADALAVLEPCDRDYRNDKMRVKAHLGLADYAAAAQVIDAFRAHYGEPDKPNVGAMMLEYLVARRKWDWARALEIAEKISRESHERDDDGKLDRWEEERFECMARLQQDERALRFGESQAVDAPSLGRLAYAAYHADRMELAGEMSKRALRLDPHEPQALAVEARILELSGDADAAIETWEQLGQVDAHWHVFHEQIARVLLARGEVEAAAERAEAAAQSGHLCPWAFGVRGQIRLVAGDMAGATADLERAWSLAAPESRDNEAHDVWAIRAALAGDTDAAAGLFETYLSNVIPISDTDRERIERVRAKL